MCKFGGKYFAYGALSTVYTEPPFMSANFAKIPFVSSFIIETLGLPMNQAEQNANQDTDLSRSCFKGKYEKNNRCVIM